MPNLQQHEVATKENVSNKVITNNQLQQAKMLLSSETVNNCTINLYVPQSKYQKIILKKVKEC